MEKFLFYAVSVSKTSLLEIAIANIFFACSNAEFYLKQVRNLELLVNKFSLGFFSSAFGFRKIKCHKIWYET